MMMNRGVRGSVNVRARKRTGAESSRMCGARALKVAENRM